MHAVYLLWKETSIFVCLVSVHQFNQFFKKCQTEHTFNTQLFNVFTVFMEPKYS